MLNYIKNNIAGLSIISKYYDRICQMIQSLGTFTVNNLRNIDFASGFSYAYDGSGIHVSQRPSSSTLTEEYHWLVESNTAASDTKSFIVRGGYWLREKEEGLGVNKIPLTCDSGVWNESYDNSYKSIQLANNVESFYIFLQLEHPLLPTTCTVQSSNAWPVYSDSKSVMVIAKANAAAAALLSLFSAALSFSVCSISTFLIF